MRVAISFVLASIGLGVLTLAEAGVNLADPQTEPPPAANATAPPAAHEAANPPLEPAAAVHSVAEPAAAKAGEEADDDTADAESKRLLTAGYRPEMRDGVKVWCRKEFTLGSRLAAQKNCGTAESLAQSVRQNQKQIDEAQRKTGFYPKNTKTS